MIPAERRDWLTGTAFRAATVVLQVLDTGAGTASATVWREACTAFCLFFLCEHYVSTCFLFLEAGGIMLNFLVQFFMLLGDWYGNNIEGNFGWQPCCGVRA